MVRCGEVCVCVKKGRGNGTGTGTGRCSALVRGSVFCRDCLVNF